MIMIDSRKTAGARSELLGTLVRYVGVLCVSSCYDRDWQ